MLPHIKERNYRHYRFYMGFILLGKVGPFQKKLLPINCYLLILLYLLIGFNLRCFRPLSLWIEDFRQFLSDLWMISSITAQTTTIWSHQDTFRSELCSMRFRISRLRLSPRWKQSLISPMCKPLFLSCRICIKPLSQIDILDDLCLRLIMKLMRRIWSISMRNSMLLFKVVNSQLRWLLLL